MGKTVRWTDRVRFFLALRRLGKIQPAAHRSGIARVTARKLLQELEAAGFSRKPRLPSLGPGELAELQDAHLAQLRRRVQALALPAVREPQACAYGNIKDVDLLEGTLPAGLSLQDALGLDLSWHLREQPVEMTMQRFLDEEMAYRGACLDLFLETVRAVASATGLTVAIPTSGQPVAGSEGAVWLDTVGGVYQGLFVRGPWDPAVWVIESHPGAGNTSWGLRQGGNTLLEGKSEQVVVQAREGLARVLGDARERWGERARDLTLRGRDLAMFQEVTTSKLRQMGEKESIIPGVCPGCPFPEKDEPLPESGRRRRGRRPAARPPSPSAGQNKAGAQDRRHGGPSQRRTP